jgi:hypothetical protein
MDAGMDAGRWATLSVRTVSDKVVTAGRQAGEKDRAPTMAEVCSRSFPTAMLVRLIEPGPGQE